MPRRKNLTELQVAKLPRKAARYPLTDPEQRHLVLRVPPQGPIAYYAKARRKGGKPKWVLLGSSATLSIDEARAKARDAARKIQAGLPLNIDPLPTVGAMADLWIRLRVEDQGYRTARERKRIISKYIKPFLGDRERPAPQRDRPVDGHTGRAPQQANGRRGTQNAERYLSLG
jgi:hypothetical protein